MPTSDAQRRARNKYNAANYASIMLHPRKEKAAEIKAHAAAQGETVSGFISRAIDNQIAQDKAKKLSD